MPYSFITSTLDLTNFTPPNFSERSVQCWGPSCIT